MKNMLVAERYEKIVGLVNERGSIRVTELSELCQVTEETIRRDLDRLEAAGRLRRSHGGAVSVKEQQSETPYAEREVTFADEKKRISLEAIRFILPHDRIVLDASTTAWYMAAQLPDLPLTVVTNSMKVATELSGKPSIEVICTGGTLAPNSLSFVGPLAERALDSYHVDKAFISCKGMHLERGISESNELQARVKQKMLEIADTRFVLADASKLGFQALTHVAEWSLIDRVITDRRMDDEAAQSLRSIGLSVQVAT